MVAKALSELVNKYMVDFSKNTYSKELEKVKYELKEKAEQTEGSSEEIDKAYYKLATKHQEYITIYEE